MDIKRELSDWELWAEGVVPGSILSVIFTAFLVDLPTFVSTAVIMLTFGFALYLLARSSAVLKSQRRWLSEFNASVGTEWSYEMVRAVAVRVCDDHPQLDFSLVFENTAYALTNWAENGLVCSDAHRWALEAREALM